MKKNKFIRKVNDFIIDNKFSMIYKNNKLDIINYTKILDFNNTLISFSYLDNNYYVEGENLVILKMMDDEMVITGNIKKISFL